MKPIMTKAELLKMIEPLSDTDVIQCQVNYTTSKTEAAYSQYKHTTEVVPITGVSVEEPPKGPNRNHKVYVNSQKLAYLQVNVEID
jgi:hypothetical protein